LVISQSVLGSADRNVDQEIALDRRPAQVEVQLGFKGDRLEKLIRQKNFLATQLKQPAR